MGKNEPLVSSKKNKLALFCITRLCVVGLIQGKKNNLQLTSNVEEKASV